MYTVRFADAIYVLEAGQVVEHGRWDDLTARPSGRLRAMLAAQDYAPVLTDSEINAR